jgi:cytochrome oxidase Cu insertion factor (SCO1/SenC/PrrC family)
MLPEVRVQGIGGEQSSLHQLLGESPVLLTLVSAHCTGLCSPYMHSLVEAIGTPRGFRVVVLSFDSRDRLEELRSFARRVGGEALHGWWWGIPKGEDLPALLEALGYRLRFSPEREEFDHTLALAVLDRRGNILRRIEGWQAVRYVQSALREARGEFVLSYPLPGYDVALRCFEVDKDSGAVRLSWGMGLLLVPPALSLLLGGMLHSLCARARKSRAI